MAMDGIDTHQQREKDDNNTRPTKKVKLQEEEISESQDAANKMMLEEKIPKSQDAANTMKPEEDIPKSHDAANKTMLEEEKIPKSQDAANKMNQEEDIPKSQDGTNTVKSRDPERKVGYIIGVKLKDIRQHEASGGDYMSLFRKVMKDAGCSESQIVPKFYGPFSFVATLTLHEAQKLSELDSVRGVKENMKNLPIQ